MVQQLRSCTHHYSINAYEKRYPMLSVFDFDITSHILPNHVNWFLCFMAQVKCLVLPFFLLLPTKVTTTHLSHIRFLLRQGCYHCAPVKLFIIPPNIIKVLSYSNIVSNHNSCTTKTTISSNKQQLQHILIIKDNLCYKTGLNFNVE